MSNKNDFVINKYLKKKVNCNYYYTKLLADNFNFYREYARYITITIMKQGVPKIRCVMQTLYCVVYKCVGA